MAEKFIGYTVGLVCNGHGRWGKCVKIEINAQDDAIKLSAVSGRNLAKMPGESFVSRDWFDQLHGDNVERAIACMKEVGYTPMALDDGGAE